MSFAAELLALPFDERDAWVDAQLGIAPPPPDVGLVQGAVPYLPCAVDDVLAAFEALALGAGARFVDVGSGLGRVTLLAHLLTGCRAHGIELQRHLVVEAQARAQALGVSRHVTFEQANAADVELDGTHFFLYAPCNGELLHRVTQRLEALGRKQPIVVAAVDVELPSRGVLRSRPSRSDAVALYGT
ncbi:MAG: methyltransferase domain-containing protein [Myxococcaceae bacterium]|nr:methyltransferase domain-containing protein [Myxococcaceae bacterium]